MFSQGFVKKQQQQKIKKTNASKSAQTKEKMKFEVVKNAKRNIVFGTINRTIVLLCPFAERIIIQKVLGSEYLGLGSLYQSVISVLSLSELGFSSAMVYNMYKPAAEGNTEKMNALLYFYRKIYRTIGLVIVLLGLFLIPFLPKLIKGSYPKDISLTMLYLIYLGNTAISYFLYAYKSSLIVVHQRDDVNSTINSIIKISLTTTQIAVLLITKNYYFFSLMMPIFTITNNLLIGWRTKKMFPQYEAKGTLSLDDISGIKRLVFGTFIQQACAVTRNSLDSICVSAYLGLTINAIYNNYYLILNGVTTFVGLITTAFMGGIGNHVATKSIEENYQEMKKLDFTYLWISGWCAICLLCLYQPFMALWMGKDMLLPFSVVILLCIYFYLLKLGDVRTLYSSANGLWWQQRYRAIVETTLNILLNILLGKKFGVYGIVISTIISLLLCNYIWSVWITFNNYFGKSKIRNYYTYQAKQTILNVAVGILTYALCSSADMHNNVFSICVRLAICLTVPNTIMFLIYRNSKQYKYMKGILFRK